MAAKSLGVALVTGASQGIGRAIAQRLAKDGFRVALNDIPKKEQELKSVSSEIEQQTGSKPCIALADVSNESQVEQMVGEATKAFGGLDVMVANAGILHENTKIVDLSAETWEKVFAINARGVFFCYKHAARQMIAQGRGGRIIGAASIAGRRSGFEHGAYGASKFAVRGLTHTAAAELGPYGITVNAYAPGFIASPMTTGMTTSALANYGFITPENFKFGEPKDVASLVSYLASKEAHYITGQTVSPNGGVYLN
ncbi:hypothetical protein GYMLUDRAFT_45815 [Collybiopsis luxurians FD-317 M1]|uniref:NAD-binding protein n=1 Tax=Collybiopsis luxurians FD-317 M1 TaxID=944289 RepID=A0A0D0BR15_9AGAR|nr:hypothetical protein GYMLUDRAFT_45815 [Collybiopsis luxurians FD-317 M1]